MGNANEKIYTLEELKKKLTEKEKNFCHEYVVDWNGARSARAAGYSENSAKEIATGNLTKLHIKQYIDFIKHDYEMLCGITKAKQINEYKKIAYSSIVHLHDSWIELTDWEEIKANNPMTLECVENIDTKTETKLEYNPDTEKKDKEVEVKYVKIKLYNKLTALERIDKLMGYNAEEKINHLNDGGSFDSQPIIKKIIIKE